MKNNIFGYIFILFAVVMAGFAIYKVTSQNDGENNGRNSDSSTVQQLEKGTEITLGISELDTMNPIITNNKKVQDIDKLIYEPLIDVTEDYKLKYTLALECAKSSEKVYIIRLRQGVKWSDGSKFTSDDVNFTINKLKEDASNSVYKETVKNIREVDIIDNYTLRIELLEDVKNFEYYLTFPILSHFYYVGEDFWNSEKNKAPTTTGRFKISEVTNNTIVLEKNETWWNKEETSTINKITINLYSTVAELYNAFKMGGIDFISTQNSSYQEYIGTIGYNVTEVEGREFVFLALNTQNGLLSDINIRKAIRASIEKNRVITNSYGWIYKPANFPINTGSYLVDEQDESFYNIDAKNNLLRASGWEARGRSLAEEYKLQNNNFST